MQNIGSGKGEKDAWIRRKVEVRKLSYIPCEKVSISVKTWGRAKYPSPLHTLESSGEFLKIPMRGPHPTQINRNAVGTSLEHQDIFSEAPQMTLMGLQGCSLPE